GGIGLWAPRIERQMTSLSRRSSAASSLAKFILAEMSEPHAVRKLRCFRSTFAGNALYGLKFGAVVNELCIGVASASNCDIGRKPRINSIVRNMLLVQYMV